MSTLPENKVIVCPGCGKKILKYNNYRKGTQDWRCYVCGDTFENPVLRKKDYYTEIIKETEYKVRRTDFEGNTFSLTKIKKIKRSNKRFFTDDDIITRHDLLKLLIKTYSIKPYAMKRTDIRNAALISFLFLTGARIAEILGVPVREGEDGTKGKMIPDKWFVEPIYKHQISKRHYQNRNITVWNVERMPVLKRKKADIINKDTGEFKRNIIRRNVSVPLSIEHEFIKHVDKWLMLLQPDDIVFDLSIQQCWRICFRFNKSYNHYWRHIRATDLTTTYGFQSIQLKHFFGWSSEAMAQRYAHLTTETLLDSMLVGYKNRGEKIEEEPPDKIEPETEEIDNKDS